LSLAIAKIGGSLLGSTNLDAWLAAVLQWNGSIVIVPGGGAFAEAVREAQRAIGFGDETAHHLALLAMDQVGVLLASRREELTVAADRGAMCDLVRSKKPMVWLPSRMALATRDIIASWDMTSDSLAAWLAWTLDATHLLLVKSRDVAGPITLHGLADAGIVDPLFPTYAQVGTAEVDIAGPAALAGASDLIRVGRMPGVAVRADVSVRS
jgi:aspartokinase-like uncharacterized kinase